MSCSITGVALALVLCLIVAFSYQGGIQLLLAFGYQGSLPPWLSAWSMNLMYLAVVAPLTWRRLRHLNWV